MDNWDGTGDQYHVDTNTRYPVFSDMQLNDYTLHNPALVMNNVNTRIQHKPIENMKTSKTQNTIIDKNKLKQRNQTMGETVGKNIETFIDSVESKNFNQLIILIIFIVITLVHVKILVDIKYEISRLNELFLLTKLRA